MSSWRRVDPRLWERHGRVLYAPWCWWCHSDWLTEWDPSSIDVEYPRAWCTGCERSIIPCLQEIYWCREPMRLSARLLELQQEYFAEVKP